MSMVFNDAIDIALPAQDRSAGALQAVEVGLFAARLHHDLATIEPAWRRLEREGVSSAYQQFDWIASVVRHLVRHGDTPLFVEIADAQTGRTLMIWPLLQRRRPSHTVITWLSCGVCDYAAPVMAAGLSLSTAQARLAWAAVRKALPHADLIRIDEVPVSVFGVANPLALLPGTTLSPHATFGTAMTGDPETLLDSLCKSSVVREIAMKERRLAKRGAVQFVAATTPAEVETLFDTLLAQRLARFAKLGRFDLLARPEAVAFYRQAALAGLSGGNARLLGLRVGDEWVATCYGLVHGGAFHISMLSIADESWRNCSPGFLLVIECMRWSRRQGLDYFDSTIGDHSYKTKIGGKPADLHVLVEPLTAVGQLVLWSQRGMERGKGWLQNQPELFERLRAIRQSLRRSLNRKPVPNLALASRSANDNREAKPVHEASSV